MLPEVECRTKALLAGIAVKTLLIEDSHTIASFLTLFVAPITVSIGSLRHRLKYLFPDQLIYTAQDILSSD